MLFNSIEYIIFLPIVVIIYFATPYKHRKYLLLIASYYFYMCWKAEYIVLIVVSTLIDYAAGLKISSARSRKKKKKFLILSLFSNLGILFGFKYFNFFNENLRELFNSLNLFYGVPAFDVLLPVGISFYTFQSLSYSIDVYYGNTPPEKSFTVFALYVSFFPQLVAGPIERSSRLLPQFFEKHDFEYNRVVSGLQLIAWGFFKKLVIADRLAIFVNEVYNHPGNYQGVPLILATYFFAFQIYCDFSGYSDIAVGSAQIMGYRLMENFRRPYFSKSISEFWKRWHISLSTWFRDYLYIPLGGKKVKKIRWLFNLFVTFFISGLWHGANWTFIIWGALHGFYLIFSIKTKNLRNKVNEFLGLDKAPFLKKFIQVFITFHLVLFAWIFFRANSIADAFMIIKNMAVFDGGILLKDSAEFGKFDMIAAFASIALMEIIHLMQRGGSLRKRIAGKPFYIRWALYIAICAAILNFGVFAEKAFIYFQF